MQSRYLKGLLGSYGFASLNIIIQIVLVPLYLRHLGKVQFGVLMMLLAYINYFSVGINWLTGGLLRLFGTHHSAQNLTAFSQAFHFGRLIYVGYAVGLGVVMIAVAWLEPGLLFGQSQATVESVLWWSVCATAIFLVFSYDLCIDRVALIAIGMQHWAYLLQIGALLIYALGAILLLKTGGNLAELMLAMALGMLAMLVVSRYIWTRQEFAPLRSITVDRAHRMDLIKQLFGRQGVGYLLYGIFVLTMQADVLFLGWLGGAEVAAEYVVLWKAAEVMVLILWRIPETLIPNFIQADVSGDNRLLSVLFWRSWRWTLGLSVAGGIAYAVFGDTVVSLWLGKDSVPNTPYAFLLAGIALFFLSANHSSAIYAYATQNFRALLYVAGLELFIKLAILYWTYHLLGYLAPLVGLITANVAGVYLLYGRLAPKKILS